MQYREPYDPLRHRRPPPRSRLPLPVSPRLLILAGAVLVPALVLAWLVFRPGGDTTEAATQPEVTAKATPSPTGVTEGAQASPEPTAAVEAGPASFGIPAPEISAAAAIVVDDASLEVLYAKDAYSRRAPASLTKIATAIVTLEHARLDDEVTSPVHYWDLGDSSTLGLEPGDVFTVRELLYGLLLVSGNDAATALAAHVSGSHDAFVEEMNRLAVRLGLEDTHFANADGLSAAGHYSSAWDLVLLSRYLMRFPDLRTIVGTEEYTASGMRGGEAVTFDLYNHNPLLNYTPDVDGVKTGFTEEAGRTFSVTAERDGHRVYIVLLDTALRAQDSQALIEWAFSNHRWPDEAAGEELEPAATATP
ncbi:MAG: D-alanyl-D-alanine carboxypeptidase family protein [Dehalococcoidia bacterium]